MGLYGWSMETGLTQAVRVHSDPTVPRPHPPGPRNPLKWAVLRAACKGCPYALPYSSLDLSALLQPHWVPPGPRAKAICREGGEMVSLRKEVSPEGWVDWSSVIPVTPFLYFFLLSRMPLHRTPLPILPSRADCRHPHAYHSNPTGTGCSAGLELCLHAPHPRGHCISGPRSPSLWAGVATPAPG